VVKENYVVTINFDDQNNMPVNSNKPERWKTDIAKSVDFYNDWFMKFAPEAFRDTRKETTKQVLTAFKLTENLTNIGPDVLQDNPSVLPMLRMSTAPPIARDRLIGLAKVSPNLVKNMEVDQRIPPKMETSSVRSELQKIAEIITKLADGDIFTWLGGERQPNGTEVRRAATIIADRLCGAVVDPIIRNAQEKRQLNSIKKWLEQRGYVFIEAGYRIKFDEMKSGTFSFRPNVPIYQEGRTKSVKIPIDTIIMPHKVKSGDFPIFIEAKSAGDFTNVNKRRKEEATKVSQLRNNYGKELRFILFLCGYFDTGYLGYEAAEGIDWVWEHRIDDLAELGI
jgi:hypothetical protein